MAGVEELTNDVTLPSGRLRSGFRPQSFYRVWGDAGFY